MPIHNGPHLCLGGVWIRGLVGPQEQSTAMTGTETALELGPGAQGGDVNPIANVGGFRTIEKGRAGTVLLDCWWGRAADKHFRQRRPSPGKAPRPDSGSRTPGWT